MSLDALRSHSELLRAASDQVFAFLDTVAEELVFEQGALLFEEDDSATTFYLIATGKVGLEVPMASGLPVLIETLGPGDLVGVSWLFPPHRWSWRARALDETTTFAFDATTVREECEVDDQLALSVYRTVAAEAVERLHAARVRVLDLYPGERH